MMVWKRSWIILTWATSCEPAGHCSEMSTSPNVKNKTTLFQWKPNANSPRIMTAWLFWKWIQKLSWLRVCVSNMLWSTCRLFLEQINVFVLRIDSFSEHLSWTHGHKLASWPEEKWKIGNRNNLLLFRQLYFRAKPHCIWAFFFFLIIWMANSYIAFCQCRWSIGPARGTSEWNLQSFESVCSALRDIAFHLHPRAFQDDAFCDEKSASSCMKGNAAAQLSSGTVERVYRHRHFFNQLISFIIYCKCHPQVLLVLVAECYACCDFISSQTFQFLPWKVTFHKICSDNGPM